VFVAPDHLHIRRAVQDDTPEIDVTDFVRGPAIGFAIAAPVGPSDCSASDAPWLMAGWSGSSGENAARSLLVTIGR
jgi:hypothetical protein